MLALRLLPRGLHLKSPLAIRRSLLLSSPAPLSKNHIWNAGMMPPSRTNTAAQTATLSSLSITFLGTASAQPSSTRNHSALALTLGGRGDVWLFDCGEATQQRVQKSDVKMGKIRKIFITHTHGELKGVELLRQLYTFPSDDSGLPDLSMVASMLTSVSCC